MTKLDHTYFRTFRIGRLYFKFIRNTELELDGWTAERLAAVLAASGYIEIIETQPQDRLGRWQSKERHYIEMPGKQISKRELLAMLKTKKENVS